MREVDESRRQRRGVRSGAGHVLLSLYDPPNGLRIPYRPVENSRSTPSNVWDNLGRRQGVGERVVPWVLVSYLTHPGDLHSKVESQKRSLFFSPKGGRNGLSGSPPVLGLALVPHLETPVKRHTLNRV